MKKEKLQTVKDEAEKMQDRPAALTDDESEKVSGGRKSSVGEDDIGWEEPKYILGSGNSLNRSAAEVSQKYGEENWEHFVG